MFPPLPEDFTWRLPEASIISEKAGGPQHDTRDSQIRKVVALSSSHESDPTAPGTCACEGGNLAGTSWALIPIKAMTKITPPDVPNEHPGA